MEKWFSTRFSSTYQSYLSCLLPPFGNSTECAQAVTEFSQERTCFGSLAEWNAWQQTIVASLNKGRFTIHLDLLHSPGLTEGLISFYNSFCTSQTCVDFYANVVGKCLKQAQVQVGILISKACEHRYPQGWSMQGHVHIFLYTFANSNINVHKPLYIYTRYILYTYNIII